MASHSTGESDGLQSYGDRYNLKREIGLLIFFSRKVKICYVFSLLSRLCKKEDREVETAQ